jgi:hypothetical protein
VEAFVPPKAACPFTFLQELAAGKKKYLLRKHVPSFKMPTWPELAVSKLWPVIQQDAAFQDYFPSKLPAGKVPDKQFFWGIIHAIKPGYAKCLVKDAMESRNKLPEAGEEDKVKMLQINEDILRKMLTAPVFLGKSALR